jgi:transcriptional regulator with XRE-family HTH domain
LLGCFVTELLIVATEKLFGFGDRVRKAREIAGFSTQKKLADALGIAQGTVGNWESGTNTPTLHQAMGLAKVLNVPVEGLFGEEERGSHGLALEATIRAIVQEELSTRGLLQTSKLLGKSLNHDVADQGKRTA